MNAMPMLPELMRLRAEHAADRAACRFFKGPALEAETLTFAQLWQAAAGLAAVLRDAGLSQQRALLVCASQRNFVVAFYACLLAGTVAVPTAPPRRQALNERLQLIGRDARTSAVIFDIDGMDDADLQLGDGVPVRIDVRAIVPSATDAAAFAHGGPAFAADAPAFLQYTSGSTGDPKGVVVSHGNLARNCAVIAEAMAVTSESSLFTALPLFHDMGLVGGVLQLMHSGCVASFLSPAEFVQYPERWLQIISTHGATVSGGPNFMYDLAARAIKPEHLAGVDLSHWQVAFCGAEPIRAATIAAFTRRFADVGFRAEAFYPCYGMAESTLFITGTRVGAPTALHAADGVDVVGCGEPRGDTRIAIVDPDTCARVADGGRGEIWVGGDSVAQGYWQRPELTARTFRATVAGEDGTTWLRTGDLGFVAGDQLYVAGRLKDLIIVNGKKYAPQDLENETERCHAGLREAGGAAFGIAHERDERVVLVCELKREWVRRPQEWPEIKRAVRGAVGTAFGVTVGDVVLIRPGALPRTSSGKVRRSQCRADYVAGALACITTGAAA